MQGFIVYTFVKRYMFIRENKGLATQDIHCKKKKKKKKKLV